MTSLISLDQVGVRRAGHWVLENISAQIEAAQITTIVGPNGAGKTTLAKLMLGLIKADSGKMLRTPKLRIGYVPQKLNIDESLPLDALRFLQLAPNASRDAINQLCHEQNISHLLKTPMRNLSGGEQQRVLLARALLSKPQLLVLDEPAQGVDIQGQLELYQLISHIREQLQCAIVMISHDLHLVMARTDQVLCLNRHLCCSGAPEAVAAHPEFARLFGRQEQQQLAVYTHHHHCGEHQL